MSPSTTLSLSQAGIKVDPDETVTVTFDIVVDDADGGVGSHTTQIEVKDTSVATITGIKLLGDPGLEEVNIADDGKTADIDAALMDTEDTGSVTIGRVDVKMSGTGTTDVTLTVETLSDELGNTYTVTGTTGTTLTTETISVDMVGDTITSGGSAELTIDATEITSLIVHDLWTDWDVTETDLAGGVSNDTVADDGTFEIEWSDTQNSAQPVLTVDIPSRYTGGTFLLGITATDGSVIASDGATIEMTSSTS